MTVPHDNSHSAARPDTLSRRRVFLALILLTFVGLVPRLALFGAYTFEGTDCDGAAYMELARNLANGAGWVTHSLRFLFLLPDSLPQPDAHWSPLYPLLTAFSFGALGDSFASAKLVPLVFGALVPGAVFLLTVSVARSFWAAAIAGLLAALHPTLVTWSLRIETEIVSVFFVAIAFAILFGMRGTGRACALGIALGLAYLTKYQSVLLWLPVVGYLLMSVPRRAAVVQTGIAAAVFVVVISPWLARNAAVFGDPFYTDLRYNVIAYYPEFGGEARYLSSLETPVGTLEYFRTHATVVAGFAKASLRLLATEFARQNLGSVLLVPFALMAAMGARRRWRERVAVLLFAVPLAVIVSVSLPQVRYLHVLIPFWIAAVAIGAGWILERVRMRRTLFAGLCFLLLAGATDEVRSTLRIARGTGGEWTPSANFCALEAQAAAEFLRGRAGPNDAVFAPETFHYALILDRNVIQVPFDDGAVRSLGERYDARYLVISVRDLRRRLPAWEDAPPAWARLVHTVASEAIPRPAANPRYADVSELRVYELAVDGSRPR